MQLYVLPLWLLLSFSINMPFVQVKPMAYNTDNKQEDPLLLPDTHRPDKSPRSSSASKAITIKGSWDEYGAGGGMNYGIPHDRRFSPRNIAFDFDVLQENAKVRFYYQATTPIDAIVISEFGQEQRAYMSGGHEYIDLTFQRPGKQTLIVWSTRGSVGSFQYIINGPVGNAVQRKPNRWTQPATSFGDEGGAGIGGNAFSSRNHLYMFEPTQGTFFDVNVEATGCAVKVIVVDPSGAVLEGYNDFGYDQVPGISYNVVKANRKGKYQIYVCTQRPNEMGTYKLDVMGSLVSDPVRTQGKFQAITGRFRPTSSQNEHPISVYGGFLEVIYRSKQIDGNTVLMDSYQQPLNPVFNETPTQQLIDRTFRIEKGGDHKLIVSNPGKKAGEYELLIWGYFKEVADNVQSQNTAIPNTVNGSSSVSNGNMVTINGKVISKNSTDFSTLRLVYENLETGKRVGEITPNRDGSYTIMVPVGQQYSITALTNTSQIASSENLDLTTVANPKKVVTLKPIRVIDNTEVGSKLVLNNIFFDTSSPILLRKSFAELKRVGAFLKANPSMKVEIAGHTDSMGDDNSNLILSQNRANAVLYYLQDQIDDTTGGRLVAKGYGEKEPTAPNTSDGGRQQNRRVEFRIIQ